MLETRDLEMIAEIMAKAIEPVQENIVQMQTGMIRMQNDIAKMRADITELRADVRKLQADVTELRTDVTKLQANVAELQANMAEVQETIAKLQADITRIDLALENEVKKGIHIIGEGHLDLSRKLELALRNREEQELMKLKVLSLEKDVKRIKEKVGIA